MTRIVTTLAFILVLGVAPGASGFGYIAQYGCTTGPDELVAGATLAVTNDGVFAGTTKNGRGQVLWLSDDLKPKGSFDVGFEQVTSLGAGSDGPLVATVGRKTTHILGTETGKLVPQRTFSRIGWDVVTSAGAAEFAMERSSEFVHELDLATGEERHSWLLPSDLFDDFWEPVGLAVSGTNPATAWIVWQHNGSVTEGRVTVLSLSASGTNLTQNATEVAQWKTEGFAPYVVATPDAVWTVSGYGRLIQRFTRGGTETARYGGADVPGGVEAITALAVDKDGNVYFRDLGDSGDKHKRIVKLGPSGRLPASGGGAESPSLDDCGSKAGSGAGKVGPATFALPPGNKPFKGLTFRLYVRATKTSDVYEKLTATVGGKTYRAGSTSGRLRPGTLYVLEVKIPRPVYDKIAAGVQAGKSLVMRTRITVISGGRRVTRTLSVRIA